MQRGRPIKSAVRQNIIEILFFLQQAYGYRIAKIYNEIFSPVTQRLIYYHLKKGILTKEIIVQQVKRESGNFSWGEMAEKIYYSLGPQAQPKGEMRVQKYLEQH